MMTADDRESINQTPRQGRIEGTTIRFVIEDPSLTTVGVSVIYCLSGSQVKDRPDTQGTEIARLEKPSVFFAYSPPRNSSSKKPRQHLIGKLLPRDVLKKKTTGKCSGGF
jgi:hypothetical protein